MKTVLTALLAAPFIVTAHGQPTQNVSAPPPNPLTVSAESVGKSQQGRVNVSVASVPVDRERLSTSRFGASEEVHADP